MDVGRRMKCQALPSILITRLGSALVAACTNATSPCNAAQPDLAVSRHGWLLGTRRKVTHSSPARSGSNANAVAVQAAGGSYKGTSATLVGTAESTGAASDSSGVSSGLELQFESASASTALTKPRTTNRMIPG